jgi:hypothetical protein
MAEGTIYQYFKKWKALTNISVFDKLKNISKKRKGRKNDEAMAAKN